MIHRWRLVALRSSSLFIRNCVGRVEEKKVCSDFAGQTFSSGTCSAILSLFWISYWRRFVFSGKCRCNRAGFFISNKTSNCRDAVEENEEEDLAGRESHNGSQFLVLAHLHNARVLKMLKPFARERIGGKWTRRIQNFSLKQRNTSLVCECRYLLLQLLKSRITRVSFISVLNEIFLETFV